jgi:exosortase H (IPTLxxWG-CTERM-specific)
VARVRFIVIFLVLLAAFEFTLLIDAVDSGFVRPFTAGIASVSASIIRVVEPKLRVTGTLISSPCFAVDIQNGCNGLEATFFVVAAVIAFPAPLKRRVIGAIAGIAIIQLANLLRVVSLFLIGCHKREWFEMFHLAIWQTIIFALAVGFFVFWSRSSVTAGRASA